jgi:hypothetical protein
VVKAAGDWELPTSIRSYLGAWEFDATTSALTKASAVLDDRREIVSMATELDLAPPDTLRKAFEGKGGMEAAATEAAHEIDAMQKMSDATDRLDDPLSPLESIGLLGRDPPSELQTARAAFEGGDVPRAAEAATRAVEALDHSADVGRGRVVVGGASVLLLDGIGIGFLFRRRHARRQLSAPLP